MSDDSRRCPVAGCTNGVPHGKLMCPDCWASVSAATRREVNDAWISFMRYSKRRISELAGLGDARERYDGAKAAALGEASARFASKPKSESAA